MVSNDYQLPSDWTIYKLGNIANVSGGKRLPKGEALTEIDNGHPYIRVANMKENGISLNNLLYVPDKVLESIKKYKIYANELYISVAGTLGLVGEVPPTLNGANLTENANRISHIKCDSKYLLYVLKSNLIQKYIEREKTISAQPKLALTRIRNFEIPVPNSRFEQQKIAAILTSVDEAIEKTEQIIEQTETVKKGLMQQLLTKGIGHTEFRDTVIGKVPKCWSVVELGEILEVSYGKNQKQVEVEVSNIPILGTGGIIGYAKEALYSEPSVLIGRKGTIDKPQYMEKPFWTIDTLFYTRINQEFAYPKFLYYVFNMIDWKKYNEATGVPSLSVKNISRVKIKLPILNEQIRIAETIDSIEEKLRKDKEKNIQLNEIKQGLMQQLLTGKVRVSINDSEEVSS